MALDLEYRVGQAFSPAAVRAHRLRHPYTYTYQPGGSGDEITIKKSADLLIVINPGRELYPETALTGHSSPEKPCQATITDTDVSILYTNWLQLSRKDLSTGTTAGVYALPAVQSKLRELRRRLAPLALCPRVRCYREHLGRFKAET